MTYVFHVRAHPLGVVVTRRSDLLGELLLPGENCYGVEYEELARVAVTTGTIEISEAAMREFSAKRS